MQERGHLLSLEATITLVAGLVVGLIPDMEWWFRALGASMTVVLAIHTGKRMEGRPVSRVLFPIFTTVILLVGTWRPIWLGFHETFPGVTEESAVAKIIEGLALLASGSAGYFFILRPRSIRGYRLLPAQVIAFGCIMIAVGLLTAGIGLMWQFRQNWNAGTTPAGAPRFALVPPQIQKPTPNPALPPPNPAPPTPFFSEYNLTEAGLNALTDELYAIKDSVSKKINLASMSTDGSSSALMSSITRVCDAAGLECPHSYLHPNSPNEKGLMIYVLSPDKPPESATKLREALRKIGVDVPFVARPDLGPAEMTFFLGPRP
jgi:hypothetical protein